MELASRVYMHSESGDSLVISLKVDLFIYAWEV